MILSPEQIETYTEWAQQYIQDKCIEYGRLPARHEGRFYSWMFYLRRGLFDPKFSSVISLLMLQKMHEKIGHFDFQISGRETAATPLLVALPLMARVYDIELNAFVVRKEQKKYGLKGWFEGEPTSKPIVLIDDLCNSSESLGTACAQMGAHRLPVLTKAFVIVNKDDEVYTDKYLPPMFEVHSIFRLKDFGLKL